MIIQVEALGKLQCVCGKMIPLPERAQHLAFHRDQNADERRGFVAGVFAVGITWVAGVVTTILWDAEETYDQPVLWPRYAFKGGNPWS